MALELLGEPAPEVTLLDTEGKPFTIKAGQSGLPMVVFFFPTAGTKLCSNAISKLRVHKDPMVALEKPARFGMREVVSRLTNHLRRRN
jgi:peroxiredoxin